MVRLLMLILYFVFTMALLFIYLGAPFLLPGKYHDDMITRHINHESVTFCTVILVAVYFFSKKLFSHLKRGSLLYKVFGPTRHVIFLAGILAFCVIHLVIASSQSDPVLVKDHKGQAVLTLMFGWIVLAVEWKKAVLNKRKELDSTSQL